MATDRPDGEGPIVGRWEREECTTYTRTTVHVERPCEPHSAAPGQRPRCSENRGGDFYTDCETCLVCDVPHQSAPELMAYVAHADSGGLHCVFTRQPKTAQEIERAIGAMCESDVCGIRYGGTDPAILRRIAARGGCADGGTDALLPSKATAARVTLRAGLWFALIAVLIGALLVLLSGVD